MRNPRRTTKHERGAVRRRLPDACRRWGIAYTARASRTLTDAVMRLALALDVPPHIIAGSDPGSNHWSATVEPGPFLFESWPAARRIRVTGFGGMATFTEDELSVVFEPLASPVVDAIVPGWCAPDDMAELYSRAAATSKVCADKLWAETPGILPLDHFEDGPYEGEGREDDR